MHLKEGLALAQSGDSVHPVRESMAAGYGGQPHAVHRQETEMNCGAQLDSFLSSHSPQPEGWTTHIQGWSFLLKLTSVETLSQTYPDLCS